MQWARSKEETEKKVEQFGGNTFQARFLPVPMEFDEEDIVEEEEGGEEEDDFDEEEAADFLRAAEEGNIDGVQIVREKPELQEVQDEVGIYADASPFARVCPCTQPIFCVLLAIVREA